MKNNYLFLIFIFLSMQPGYSQKVLYEEQGESFTLSSYLIPYNSYKYTATQNIKLTDGENSSFKYSPMPGQSFQAEINPFQVLPPEAGEVGGPNPNDDGVVGTIPGSAFVGSSGAASYQIPIEALPGINGMTPNLSLIYNSNSGNGLLGIGWMIGGMSGIQRTGTIIYHEGYVDGVDFDDNDKLMLNGNRLIPVGDNEYRTEIETFSKIEAMNIVNGWPQWFRVYTKSGHIYEYGNSEDSRIQAPGRNDVMSWNVNKISDRTGNYIKFQYVEEHGMARISTIEYADDGSGAVNSMNFYYSGGRIDNIKYYRAGCEFMLNVLLDSIQVNYMQTNVKTYVMEYNTNDMYSKLSAITLWDEGRDQHFNPTTFEWGESKLAFDSEPSNITNNSEADIVTGDFNGDGKTDVATAFYTISYDSQRDKEFTTWSVYFSNSSHGTSFERLDIGDLPGGFSHFVVIDYNGDGLDDLVQILSNSYNYLESTGTGFSAPVYGGYHIGNVENHCEFAPVDLNGNGIGDLLLISKSNNGKAFNYRIDAFEFDGNDFISIIFDPSGQQGFSWSSPAEYLEILPGDFNGDGKTELLIEIQNNNCTVYGLNETGNILEVVYSDVFNIPISSMALKTLTGDINGDGITDLVTVSYDDPPILTIRLLNGQDGWSDLNADISFPASNHLEKYDFYYNYIVADFNGDSKSDVLLGYTEYKRDHASDPWELVGRHWDTYYSNGTGVVKEPNFIGGGPLFHPYLFDIRYPHCDFNGDGNNDNFIFDGGFSGNKEIVFFHKNEQVNFMQKITNGLGTQTKISYEPMTNNTIYTRGTINIDKIKNIQNSMHVVDTICFDDGLGGWFTQVFLYEGAAYHLEGKGFLGFSDTHQKDLSTGLSVSKTSYLHPDYFVPYVFYIHNFSNLPPQMLSEEQIKYEIHDFGNKRIFIYNNFDQINIFRTGDETLDYVRTIRKLHHYNTEDINYGNISSDKILVDEEDIHFAGANSNFDYYTINNYDYNYNDIDDWLISRPEQHTVTKKSPDDETEHYQQYNYAYYGSEYPQYPLLKTTTVRLKF